MRADKEVVYTFQFSKNELDSIDAFLKACLYRDAQSMDVNVIQFSADVDILFCEED